jgi:hypothetical protein
MAYSKEGSDTFALKMQIFQCNNEQNVKTRQDVIDYHKYLIIIDI